MQRILDKAAVSLFPDTDRLRLQPNPSPGRKPRTTPHAGGYTQTETAIRTDKNSLPPAITAGLQPQTPTQKEHLQ